MMGTTRATPFTIGNSDVDLCEWEPSLGSPDAKEQEQEAWVSSLCVYPDAKIRNSKRFKQLEPVFHMLESLNMTFTCQCGKDSQGMPRWDFLYLHPYSPSVVQALLKIAYGAPTMRDKMDALDRLNAVTNTTVKIFVQNTDPFIIRKRVVESLKAHIVHLKDYAFCSTLEPDLVFDLAFH